MKTWISEIKRVIAAPNKGIQNAPAVEFGYMQSKSHDQFFESQSTPDSSSVRAVVFECSVRMI